MKAKRIILFILFTHLILGVVWFIYPKQGIHILGVELRFPNFETKAEEKPGGRNIDVDSILHNIERSFIMNCSESLQDSLHYFRNFLKENSSRIHFPEGDYTFFDPFFQMAEQNRRKGGAVIRVMHYGDSQIEMDRISSVLRQYFQETFGGNGVGMIPVIQRVASTTLSQEASGSLQRYIVFGDSTTRRASHNRYGVMAQFSQLSGNGSLWFRCGRHKSTQPNARQFSRISLLVGNAGKNFTAKLGCDTFRTEVKHFPEGEKVALLRWDLPHPVEKGTLRFNGTAEIYGVMLDGDGGVALDNDALRGCSGTIFTRLDEELLRQSFALLNTRIIILQFGGNRMPSIKTDKNISSYMKQIEQQIRLFQRVAPQASILFIGPSDMGRVVNGRMDTWPKLPELNDSLRMTALRNDAAYWDLFSAMGGENSMVNWVKHVPALAGSDYIHFTDRGAREVGTILSNSMQSYYNFYQLRKQLPADSVFQFIHEREVYP